MLSDSGMGDKYQAAHPERSRRDQNQRGPSTPVWINGIALPSTPVGMNGARAAYKLLLLGALVLCSCEKPPEIDQTPPPQVILTGARLRSFRGSELSATGRAAQVAYERTGADFTASEVFLRLPSRDTPGSPNPSPGWVEIRSPVVVGNRTTEQADGSGGVVVRSASGMVGRTPRAHYDGVTKVASGKDPVSVNAPRYAVTAESFLLRFEEENFRFTGHVVSHVVGGVEGPR